MLANRCGVSEAMLPTVACLVCLHISQACSPGPALDPAPGPAMDPAPAPALDPAPGPALDPTPAPALDPAPAPALDPAEFLEHRSGNTNLVISAPHGGSLRPEALPRREAGCRGPGLARYTQLSASNAFTLFSCLLSNYRSF